MSVMLAYYQLSLLSVGINNPNNDSYNRLDPTRYQ